MDRRKGQVMFRIVIVPMKAQTQQIFLFFKTPDSAASGWTAVQGKGPIKISDDYGQTYACDNPAEKINSLIFEDMKQMQEAQIAITLEQQRMQSRYDKIARVDPELMSANLIRGGGVPVLSPMGGQRN